jgi:hypothetical protein
VARADVEEDEFFSGGFEFLDGGGVAGTSIFPL